MCYGKWKFCVLFCFLYFHYFYFWESLRGSHVCLPNSTLQCGITPLIICSDFKIKNYFNYYSFISLKYQSRFFKKYTETKIIGTHNFVVSNQKTDNNGRILILDVTINDVTFVFINLYNANTETEQNFVFNNLSSLLENFDVTLEKNLILARDFNLFLNSKLDAKGRKPTIKKNP